MCPSWTRRVRSDQARCSGASSPASVPSDRDRVRAAGMSRHLPNHTGRAAVHTTTSKRSKTGDGGCSGSVWILIGRIGRAPPKLHPTGVARRISTTRMLEPSRRCEAVDLQTAKDRLVIGQWSVRCAGYFWYGRSSDERSGSCARSKASASHAGCGFSEPSGDATSVMVAWMSRIRYRR